MKVWKKGALLGAFWGFISWFGLEVAMSKFYLPLSFNCVGCIWRDGFRELVKITLFLPAKVVVVLLNITSETDPVSGAFQNIALFIPVIVTGIALGVLIYKLKERDKK